MIHYTNIHNNFSVPDTLEDGAITNESGTVKRNSKVSFIKDVETCREIFNTINSTTLLILLHNQIYYIYSNLNKTYSIMLHFKSKITKKDTYF